MSESAEEPASDSSHFSLGAVASAPDGISPSEIPALSLMRLPGRSARQFVNSQGKPIDL